MSAEEQEMETLSLKTFQSKSYINPDLTLEQKILSEKQRRYQAYMRLDYLLSVVSYFDFFSLDAFQITKKAKELTQFCEKKTVTSDLLLLPFFDSNKEVVKLLEKYGVNRKLIGQSIWNSQKPANQTFQEKGSKLIKNILLRIDIPIVSEFLIVPKKTKYSYEINQIFEKAADNALTRFKTPVISSEILLITMLEAKKSKAGKLLKHYLKTDLNWYMLRFCLMKRLHQQELAIRIDLPTNYQYFAYLLKANLPELQFDTLLDKDCLLPGVLLFRNTLISDAVKFDLYKELKRDILTSIKSTKVRTYSV
jgi:ATP-dependent Clp protease ATP-binding subunit ClpA